MTNCVQSLFATAVTILILAGCSEEPKPAAPLPTVPSSSAAGAGAAALPASGAEAPDGKTSVAGAATEVGALSLEGMTFTLPTGWTKVDPPSSRIVEAEYLLPRDAGDEFDGRLTVMAAGGDNASNIDRWKSEFVIAQPDDAKVESVKPGAAEMTIVDIRGTWKGPSFKPQPPRSDYRMLAAIIPVPSGQAYYVKAVGPRATIQAFEESIRKFITSAQPK